MDRHEHFHRENVDVRIQRDVLEFLRPEEMIPDIEAEAVMENDRFFDRQISSHPLVGSLVELPQERQRHEAGALRLFLILCFSGRRRRLVDEPADRLVQDLDPVQAVPFSVAFRETLQHGQREFHLFRMSAPFADAGDAAVIIPVLAVRNGVQIEQDLHVVFLRPVECFIDIFDTADKGRPVAEDKVRHGKTYELHAVFRQESEIIFCHIRIAVFFQKCREFIRRRLSRKPGLILRSACGKQIRFHPFFQYQPVAEIRSVYLVHHCPISFEAAFHWFYQIFYCLYYFIGFYRPVKSMTTSSIVDFSRIHSIIYVTALRNPGLSRRKKCCFAL